MWLSSVLLLPLAILGTEAQVTSPTPIPASNNDCILSFTPYMPPQIGPTSTVYGAIMTTMIYVGVFLVLGTCKANCHRLLTATNARSQILKQILRLK
jgi:hypothetical protein